MQTPGPRGLKATALTTMPLSLIDRSTTETVTENYSTIHLRNIEGTTGLASVLDISTAFTDS